MENQITNSKKSSNKKKTDNLILILFAYYLASVPIALVISGLVYPYLGNVSYVLFLILSIVFLSLTYMVQKLNNTARITLSVITVLLLVGSIFFPLVIPNSVNPILSHMDIYYHNLNIGDYLFYLLAVDGSFLIFGAYMLWGINIDKKTLNLFKE